MQFENVYFILGPNALDAITFSEYLAKLYLTHISDAKGSKKIDYKIIKKSYNKMSKEELQLVEDNLEYELLDYGFEHDDETCDCPKYLLTSCDIDMLENDIHCRGNRTMTALNKINFYNAFLKLDDEERKIIELFHMMLKKKYDDFLDQDEIWDHYGEHEVAPMEFFDYQLCYSNYLMLYK